MSTITAPPPSPATKPPLHTVKVVMGEQRVVIRDVKWHVYETVVDSIGEGQHVRVAYDGKDMELMVMGYLHEDYKTLFGRLMNAVTVELDISCLDAGETTWKRPHVDRGIESDQSYYFDPVKMAVAEAALALKSNNIDDYPNPDLAIEIDISTPDVDRQGIYKALRVSEVWRFNDTGVTIERLDDAGAFVALDSSGFLPIRSDEIARWVFQEETSDLTAWKRRLRDWIRAELAGRRRVQ
jgi:Uma2 family endonuclease